MYEKNRSLIIDCEATMEASKVDMGMLCGSVLFRSEISCCSNYQIWTHKLAEKDLNLHSKTERLRSDFLKGKQNRIVSQPQKPSPPSSSIG